MSSTILCAGCGWIAPPLQARPFRCPRAGRDDVDHVLARRLTGRSADPFFDPEPNPFVRYRTFTHAWHTAQALGMSDGEFVRLVRDLDARIAAVDGRGFTVTPLEQRGGVWVKDETNHVAGSHKARHLMGLMLWLAVAERLDPSLRDSPLAIASCGNAALAAATIARAAGRRLLVFVPEDASPSVIARLRELGASVTPCSRDGDVAGDPAYRAFRAAVAAGALPFTCQGPENGLVIEGGQTLGWEMASQLAAARASIEDLFIQVGGGALASACVAGLEEARAAGVIAHMPRIHAVQTLASPLLRAFERARERGMDYAVRHRSEFMWPWEAVPHSIATGILDDETYDWAAVLRGVLATGGSVVAVSEDELREANRLAGPGVSATGSAGLAGLLRSGVRGPAAVLFTGASDGRPASDGAGDVTRAAVHRAVAAR